MADAPAFDDDKKVLFGGQNLPIIDPGHTVPVVAEVITELRLNDGILALSLGSVVKDGTAGPRVLVCCRLRLPVAMISTIQRALEAQAAEIERAKKVAN